jgi:hypothetical protein
MRKANVRYNTTGTAAIVHESRSGTPVSSRSSTFPSSGTLPIPRGSLGTWRSELRHELPELREFRWRGKRSKHKGKVNAAFLERLDGIFTGIENYNASPGKSLSEIYVRSLRYLSLPGLLFSFLRYLDVEIAFYSPPTRWGHPHSWRSEI